MESNKTLVCNVCKRRFATKAALAQHKRDSHSGGGNSNRPPKGGKSKKQTFARQAVQLAIPAYNASVNTATARVRGSDVLASISIKADKVVAGLVVARLVLSPRLFNSTRLCQTAQLWQRWRPNYMKFTIQTTLPTVAGGQIAAAWSSDHLDRLPSDPTLIARKLGVLKPHVIAHMWELLTINVNEPPVQKWLYTDPKQDDADHGCVFVVITGPPLNYTGSFIFTIQCEWDINFESPDITTDSDISEVAQADEGYYPYFTTYSKTLIDSSKLTLQDRTSGGYGGMVRFSSMQPGKIYEPVKEDQLQYYSDGTTLKSVAALVLMHEVGDPFVWCFASVADAKAYIDTSDLKKVITYKAGGPWCNGNPLWKPKAAVALLDNSNGSLEVAAPPRPMLKQRVEDSGVAGRVAALEKALSKFSKGTFTDPVVITPLPIPPESVSSFGELGDDEVGDI